MPPLPTLRPKEAVAAFERLGWQVVRRRGSHIVMCKPGDVATLSVPDHDQVAKGTLRALIRSANLTVAEFLEALE